MKNKIDFYHFSRSEIKYFVVIWKKIKFDNKFEMKLVQLLICRIKMFAMFLPENIRRIRCLPQPTSLQLSFSSHRWHLFILPGTVYVFSCESEPKKFVT